MELCSKERDRTRKLTRGIQGFGSFCRRSSSASSSARGILKESSFETYGRSNSQSHFINDEENQENQFSSSQDFTKKVDHESKQMNGKAVITEVSAEAGSSSSWPETQTSFKENMAPIKEEPNPLLGLGGKTEGLRVEISAEDEHPFNDIDNQSSASLLAA